MRRCFIIAAFLIATIASQQRAAAQAPAAAADPLRHGHALLIGNSNYGSWPRLDDVPLQLNALAAGLKSHFDTVTVKKDLKIEELRREINGFLRSYGYDPNARLFIYYAGHGYSEPILQFSTYRGFITGVDTPSVEKGYDAARPNAMSMLEIQIPLAEALAKHILIVFDSCFAGTIFLAREGNPAARELTPDVVARLMERPSRDIITAGRANERVPAHSPIPSLLLAALNGEADAYKTGVISAAQINGYLRSQVLRMSGVNLTPQEGRLQDPNFAEGEFLFRVPSSITRSSPGAPGGQTENALAAQVWAVVQGGASGAVLEDYIRQFGGTPYGSLARARLAELQRTAAVAPPVVPAVPPADPCGGPVTVSFAARCAAPLTAAQERGLKPKDSFRECENCPEMVVVPAGSFTMGSRKTETGRYEDEGPQHTVKIAKPFAAGKFHVTVHQFAVFVKETGYDAGSKCYAFEDGKWVEQDGRSWRDPGFSQAGSHPAVCLNWDDAKAYVDWLARTTGKGYRLLTEAEWEYAARGRTAPGAYPRFSFGNDDKDLCRYGNGADQATKSAIPAAKDWTIAPCNDGFAYTSPVGSFAANAFGLYDMQGNAWQWNADCYHDSYAGAPADGTAWTTGDCGRRVVRGGSWINDPWNLRAAVRFRSTVRVSNFGFRVGRTLTP